MRLLESFVRALEVEEDCLQECSRFERAGAYPEEFVSKAYSRKRRRFSWDTGCLRNTKTKR